MQLGTLHTLPDILILTAEFTCLEACADKKPAWNVWEQKSQNTKLPNYILLLTSQVII